MVLVELMFKKTGINLSKLKSMVKFNI